MKTPPRVSQNRQQIKYQARSLLSGRLLVCFIAWVLPTILPWAMRLISIDFGIVNILVADLLVYRVSVPMFLLSLVATTFVTDPMYVKVAGFYLTLHRTPDGLPSPLSVCDCFGPGYLRLVTGMLLRSLIVLLWGAVPLCLGVLMPGTWEWVVIEGEQVIRLTNLAYVFVLLAAVAVLYRDLAFTMVPYILFDRPELTARQALRESVDMTRGRIWELLVLQLSFFGWLMFASITLMIGSVYTYPYIESTMAAYYLAFLVPMPWEPKSLKEPDEAG